MAKTFFGALVQLAGVALGASATVLYGAKSPATFVVEAIGSLLPFCALIFCLRDKREGVRRLCLLIGSGSWLGNRMAIALSLASLPTGTIRAWISPLLMGATFAAAWVSLRQTPESQSTEESELIELKWEAVLEKLPGYESLSRREREVLELILAGKSGREIADALHIAPSTAGSYRARTYEKLHVSSKREVLSTVAWLLSDEASTSDNEAPSSAKAVVPPSLLILLACVICSIAGLSIYRPFLVLMAVLSTGAIGCVAAWRTNVRQVDIVACLAGASAGFALSAGLYGNWPVAPFVVAALITAGCLLTRSPSWSHPLLGAICASLFIPGAGTAGNLADSPISMLLLSGFLLVVARLVDSALKQKGKAQALELVSAGERRTMAYLEGRGLSELKAKIVLLTACGFDSTSIADALYVSTSTVSNYRSGAYKVLLVSNRQELVSLLQRDAGYEGFLAEGANHNEARAP